MTHISFEAFIHSISSRLSSPPPDPEFIGVLPLESTEGMI